MKLARSAHPEATEKQLQATALEHFMCGLSDLTLQERLHNRDDIVSLNTAIVAANNYQKKEAVLASMRTTQGSSMAMAACQTKPPSRRVADTQGHNSKEMISVIDELKKEVKELQMQLQGAKAGEHRAGKEQGCYQCGNITHFKRDCPILGRSRQQEAQPLLEQDQNVRVKISLIAKDVTEKATGCQNAGGHLPRRAGPVGGARFKMPNV